MESSPQQLYHHHHYYHHSLAAALRVRICWASRFMLHCDCRYCSSKFSGCHRSSWHAWICWTSRSNLLCCCRYCSSKSSIKARRCSEPLKGRIVVFLLSFLLSSFVNVDTPIRRDNPNPFIKWISQRSNNFFPSKLRGSNKGANSQNNGAALSFNGKILTCPASCSRCLFFAKYLIR